MNTLLESLKQDLLRVLQILGILRAKQTQQTPVIVPTPDPLTLLWDNAENARHSVRVICDDEGLTVEQKNQLSATVHCESNYNPACIHPNIVSGKTLSTDYGICQVNDYYHIGVGKSFISEQFVLNNPEACVRWMARQFKTGNAKLWVCFSKNLYKSYSA